MNTILIAKSGTDLSSRSTGARLRQQVLSLAKEGRVVLDFADVRSVSHSFADEFLAVLVEEQGEPWFRDHVKLVNHSSAVRLAILDAIQYRLVATGRAA